MSSIEPDHQPAIPIQREPTIQDIGPGKINRATQNLQTCVDVKNIREIEDFFLKNHPSITLMLIDGGLDKTVVQNAAKVLLDYYAEEGHFNHFVDFTMHLRSYSHPEKGTLFAKVKNEVAFAAKTFIEDAGEDYEKLANFFALTDPELLKELSNSGLATGTLSRVFQKLVDHCVRENKVHELNTFLGQDRETIKHLVDDGLSLQLVSKGVERGVQKAFQDHENQVPHDELIDLQDKLSAAVEGEDNRYVREVGENWYSPFLHPQKVLRSIKHKRAAHHVMEEIDGYLPVERQRKVRRIKSELAEIYQKIQDLGQQFSIGLKNKKVFSFVEKEDEGSKKAIKAFKTVMEREMQKAYEMEVTSFVHNGKKVYLSDLIDKFLSTDWSREVLPLASKKTQNKYENLSILEYEREIANLDLSEKLDYLRNKIKDPNYPQEMKEIFVSHAHEWLTWDEPLATENNPQRLKESVQRFLDAAKESIPPENHHRVLLVGIEQIYINREAESQPLQSSSITQQTTIPKKRIRSRSRRRRVTTKVSELVTRSDVLLNTLPSLDTAATAEAAAPPSDTHRATGEARRETDSPEIPIDQRTLNRNLIANRKKIALQDFQRIYKMIDEASNDESVKLYKEDYTIKVGRKIKKGTTARRGAVDEILGVVKKLATLGEQEIKLTDDRTITLEGFLDKLSQTGWWRSKKDQDYRRTEIGKCRREVVRLKQNLPQPENTLKRRGWKILGDRLKTKHHEFRKAKMVKEGSEVDKVFSGAHKVVTIYEDAQSKAAVAHVKIKDRSPLTLASMEREVHNLQKLRGCDNIVQFHNKVYYGDQEGYLQEFCGGGTIDEYLSSVDDELIRSRIAFDILKGIQQAHSKGIIHRDLHEENVMIQLNEDGSFKKAVLVDLGEGYDPNYGDEKKSKKAHLKLLTPATIEMYAGDNLDIVLAAGLKAFENGVDYWAAFMLLSKIYLKDFADFNFQKQCMKELKKVPQSEEKIRELQGLMINESAAIIQRLRDEGCPIVNEIEKLVFATQTGQPPIDEIVMEAAMNLPLPDGEVVHIQHIDEDSEEDGFIEVEPIDE